MSTFDASVSCGTPSRSATIAGTTPVRASVDSDPKITRSNPTACSAAASAADVASASDPARPSSITCTALSAPIDSALRIDSAALRRAHRQDRHLAAVRLGDLQALLDRVLIELVDQPVERGPVQRALPA